ncbi:probable mitochondrial ferredoxin [Cephalotrichum gorgonifer]|uniref:Probable mitochondrial ferredoxin n=1 Tax=Cephalotrichum gorgonifer TaxID=2041049 RepID=A0AAE8MWN2_9PEZI|nr:probable mitochondrial ferredoxin [Cephalotrichum gorgonifer]
MSALKSASAHLGRLALSSTSRATIPSTKLAIHTTRSWSSAASRSSLLPSKTSRYPTFQTTRAFSATSSVAHGHVHTPKPGEELYVTFIDKDGTEVKLAVCEGDNLLDIAQANDLEMEGACGGSCACSTCHVIVTDDTYYERMPEPDDDENDMLDLAFGLTETSRLGCQVTMTKELDGLTVKLPSMTRNLQASDFKS